MIERDCAPLSVPDRALIAFLIWPHVDRDFGPGLNLAKVLDNGGAASFSRAEAGGDTESEGRLERWLLIAVLALIVAASIGFSR